jgi:hypothetical protein
MEWKSSSEAENELNDQVTSLMLAKKELEERCRVADDKAFKLKTDLESTK